MSEKVYSVFDDYPEYEANIGIEVHVQLKTKSKMFCSCPSEFGSTPNQNICPICCGYPGALPVLNRKAVDYALMLGLATQCKIPRESIFARKHYMYPDLPKKFQITQDDKPICREGLVPIEMPDGSAKDIRLIRIHMEEDAGKNIHASSHESFVDLNRAGTPLLEVVSYPDLTSAEEARIYLMRLRAIVQYLGISDANMEEGSFRADTNISVRKKGAELGTRVELKNINSFKFIGQAINYEIRRQLELIESGGTVAQQTRLWDVKAQESVVMRSKEEAQDYRYFAEPDLPPLLISEDWIESVAQKIPELPHQKYARFQKEYGLSAYDAEQLVSQSDMATFFEETVALCKNAKMTCNWILRDLLAYLNEKKITLNESVINPEMLAELVSVIDKGIINSKVAQEVFLDMMEHDQYPSIIIQEKNLQQISSPEELEAIVVEIIAKNADSVEKYRAGNERLFGFFVGQAMKATNGKGNPQLINELLKKHLA